MTQPAPLPVGHPIGHQDVRVVLRPSHHVAVERHLVVGVLQALAGGLAFPGMQPPPLRYPAVALRLRSVGRHVSRVGHRVAQRNLSFQAQSHNTSFEEGRSADKAGGSPLNSALGLLVPHMAAANHEHLARLFAAVLVGGRPAIVIGHRDRVGLGFGHVENRHAVVFERVVEARLVHAHRAPALSAFNQLSEHLVQPCYCHRCHLRFLSGGHRGPTIHSSRPPSASAEFRRWASSMLRPRPFLERDTAAPAWRGRPHRSIELMHPLASAAKPCGAGHAESGRDYRIRFAQPINHVPLIQHTVLRKIRSVVRSVASDAQPYVARDAGHKAGRRP